MSPRRFVIFGAGAIGSVIGAHLFEHGHEVVLIARGATFGALSERGLILESPTGTARLSVPVVPEPSRVDLRSDDIVLLTMKGQDTLGAVGALSALAPPSVAIVCAQNGVENERVALRQFPKVYGMYVMCPATNEEPGVVRAHSAPISGILDLGCWPTGTDEDAEQVAFALSQATFSSHVLSDVSSWKWGKLLMNLANAVEAICGLPARDGEVAGLVRTEGMSCLDAAGISYVSSQEMAERRADLLRPLAGGSSSWQSLQRRAGSIETDYLNGEIVLLGRQWGVPTPANAIVQRCANDLARRRLPPGSMAEDELLGLIRKASTG